MFARTGIGTRIAGGSFAISVVICVIAGLLLNARVEQILRASTESILTSVAAPYTEAIRTEPDENFDTPGPSQHVAVIDPDGKVHVDTLDPELSKQMRSGQLSATSGRQVETSSGDYVVHVEKTGSNQKSSSGQNPSSEQRSWSVVSARPLSEEHEVLAPMRALIIVALAIIAGAVFLASLLLTSAALRPVRRIRRTAERLIDSSDDETLPVGPADDEIAHLARTLNELIGKLRDSAQRERQMVSDASHELRTPLALLQTRLELARTDSHTVEALIADVEGAENSAKRMSALVDSLLTLSSIEAAGPKKARADELAEEIGEAIDRAIFRTKRNDDAKVNIRDTITVDSGGTEFALTPHDLGRITDNLVSNALRAMAAKDRPSSPDAKRTNSTNDTTNALGTITVSFAASATRLRLTVADDGGGMPEDFVDRAFDRFSQSDESRTAGSGTGLGLAIVAAIVDRAGGTIVLENRPGTGLNVQVDIPTLGVDSDGH